MSADWEEHARCRVVGVEVFFPEGNGGRFRAAADEAKAVCDGCPVRRQCLDYALRIEGGAEAGSRAGIWGGLTPRERHAIHRQQRDRTAA